MGKIKMMLNGIERDMDNFGADPLKEGFNRWAVNVPSWDELSRPVKAHLNAFSIDQAGYEHALTVLTQIKAQVIKQKFYEVNPSDFMPVVVGEGAWMQNLVYNSVYMDSVDFEAGITDSSRPFSKKHSTDIEVIATSIPIVNWNRSMSYSIIEISQAAKGNVDVVSTLEEARKKSWDLGIQRIAFLGSRTRSDIKGLYTLDNVTVNNSFITAPISSLSAEDFQNFVSGILTLYARNCSGTVLPNRFCMPLSDYLGLSAAASPNYPLVSKIEYLENAFKKICGNDFKIVSTAYGIRQIMSEVGVSAYRYILYRDDPEVLEFNIPVAYTTTTFGTANGFDFENVAMGQFSSVFAKRPQEILYLDDTHTS